MHYLTIIIIIMEVSMYSLDEILYYNNNNDNKCYMDIMHLLNMDGFGKAWKQAA